MTHHAAYGLTFDDLDIIVVEDAKPMQAMLRTILAALHPVRIRLYDNAEEAMQAMLSEPPNLVITDLRMKPVSGYQLVQTIRNRGMAPLCYVPVIMVTAHATREITQKALLAGVHHVLVKPLAPATLIDRIRHILQDGRQFEDNKQGRLEIAGVRDQLAAQETRKEMLERARAYHETTIRRIAESQSKVDRLLEETEALGMPEPDVVHSGPTTKQPVPIIAELLAKGERLKELAAKPEEPRMGPARPQVVRSHEALVKFAPIAIERRL